jgi:peptidoglycan/xylan/chitin deacetylase (PgdA/CDA1 family)
MNAAVYVKRAIRRSIGRVAPIAWNLKRKKSLVILTYHRVLPEDHPDRLVEQPGMCVSPQTLAMHLRVLEQHFEFIDLSEWLDRREKGKALPPRACSITFDDGWRDNHQFAFPILKASDVPVTIFLVADFIGSNYEFWPNRLARLLRGRVAQPGLSNEIGRLLDNLGIDLGSAEIPLSLDEIDRIIGACKGVPDDHMNDMLAGLDHLGTSEGVRRRRHLLDLDEIAEMSTAGRIRFGSHSRRHLRLLEHLSPDKLHEEIVQSRVILRRLTGQEVDVFCYPNGDYSPEAIRLVRSEYRAAVTTGRGWNFAQTDACLLKRVSLHDDISSDEPSFLARVAGLL